MWRNNALSAVFVGYERTRRDKAAIVEHLRSRYTSPTDAELAARAIRLIQEEEQAFEKTIPYRILFTRTSPAIATKLEKQITSQLTAGEVPTFRNHLYERSAYKALFYHQLDLAELDPSDVNGLPAARDNALRRAEELVDLVANVGAVA